MPFTFPHFGSLKYVFERVLKELGRNDIIMPHRPSKKTSNLGSRYSPEFICTPFRNWNCFVCIVGYELLVYNIPIIV